MADNKQMVELIIISNNQMMVDYKGSYNLVIDDSTKNLSFKSVNNEQLNSFSISFDNQYIQFCQQENILCIFDFFFQSCWSLIFKNLEKCKEFYSKILKLKPSNKESNKNVENQMFVNIFLFPIFIKILNESGKNCNAKSDDEILKVLNSNKFYASLFSNSLSQNVTKNANGNAGGSERSVISSSSSVKTTSVTEVDRKNMMEFPTKHQNATSSKSSSVPFLLSERYKDDKVPPSGYIMKEKKFKDKFHKRLIIFASDDKKFCYEYCEEGVSFYCRPCQNKYGIYSMAKLIYNEFEGGEYVKLNQFKHQCEPKKYNPDDFSIKIIKKPYFELQKNGKSLWIFDENNSNLYYNFTLRGTCGFLCSRCTRKRKSVFASIYKDEIDGEDYVELTRIKHVCKPLKLRR